MTSDISNIMGMFVDEVDPIFVDEVLAVVLKNSRSF